MAFARNLAKLARCGEQQTNTIRIGAKHLSSLIASDTTASCFDGDTLDLLAIPEAPVFTSFEQLAAFGPRCERIGKLELVAGARKRVGGTLDHSFTRFVNWLRSEGYTFAGFDAGPIRYDQRRIYLRYDVHTLDLLPAYVLADLHERFGIVGSFQITWKFWPGDEHFEPFFTKLLEFDRQFVEFGLHAAPVATWYINERFGGDPRAATASVGDDDFSKWIFDLHAAYCRDGHDAPVLRAIRNGVDDTLAAITASARATFGDLKSVSGHGNFLTGGYNRLRQLYPQISVLEPYFSMEGYFLTWGVRRFGFNHLARGVGSDSIPFPRMMFEGFAPELRRRLFRGRVAGGGGFVALFHPASWTCQQNATFFLHDEPPRSPA